RRPLPANTGLTRGRETWYSGDRKPHFPSQSGSSDVLKRRTRRNQRDGRVSPQPETEELAAAAAGGRAGGFCRRRSRIVLRVAAGDASDCGWTGGKRRS